MTYQLERILETPQILLVYFSNVICTVIVKLRGQILVSHQLRLSTDHQKRVRMSASPHHETSFYFELEL